MKYLWIPCEIFMDSTIELALSITSFYRKTNISSKLVDKFVVVSDAYMFIIYYYK